MQPNQIGKYQILSFLGQGNMGIVYQVQDPKTGKKYALKQILLESQAHPLSLHRFEQEQKILRSLQHPHIVGFQDAGQEKGLPYFVMDLIQGQPLSQLLSHPLPWEKALGLALVLAETLYYAHQKGIIHRDLKPQNILIQNDGMPVLMDFGIARTTDSMKIQKTASGKVLGTLAYMSPEQALGSQKEIGPASDVYSLGCILYEMITGKLPLSYQSKTQKEILYEIASHNPLILDAFPSSTPFSVQEICRKALAKDRQSRYSTAQELSYDIQKALPEKQSSFMGIEQKDTKEALLDVSPEPLRETVGNYSLEKELGRGGMGVVYLATDSRTGRKVALKLMGKRGQPKDQERFLKEARVLACLKHPHLVCLYEADRTPELYFAMEYLEGKTLASFPGKNKRSIHQSALFFLKIAQALHFVHEQGIIHRDIKPANIMIVSSTQEPKIMDFGLAKVLQEDQSLSQSNHALGTLLYMPPEQAQGMEVDARADIYSLGATFYEYFSGRPVFSEKTPALILNSLFQKDPVPLRKHSPKIPREMEAIIGKCLQKKPQDRYETAQALAQDLENFLQNKPIQAKPAHLFQRAFLWTKRNPLAGLLLASISLCLVFCLLALQKALYAKSLLEENQQHLVSLHYKQGCVHYHQKDWGRALECFSQALQKKEDFQSHWMMACLYLLEEKTSLAQRSLQKAWDIAPQKYPQILLLQSLCHAEEKNKAKAQELWQRVQKSFFSQQISLPEALERESAKNLSTQKDFRMPLPEETLIDKLARAWLIAGLLPPEEAQNALWNIGKPSSPNLALEEFYKTGFLLYYTDSGWQKDFKESVPMLSLKEMVCYVQGKWILDMATPYWTRLSPSTQAKYAALYQSAYARYANKPVQTVFEEKSKKTQKKISFSMVFIPPGQFLIGKPFEKEGDGPQKQLLVLEPFYMSQTEVTQEQWFLIAGNTPWIQKGTLAPYTLEHPHAPVSNVSWEQIQTEFLSGLDSSYSLPHEIEWEYACRAGTTSPGFWGDEEAGKYVWHKKNALDPDNLEASRLKKTRTTLPNPWHLYDMAGNVEEICNNAFFPYALLSEKKEWYWKETGKTRIYRGGNIGSNIAECYSTARCEIFYDQINPVLGFRLLQKAKAIPINRDGLKDKKGSD